MTKDELIKGLSNREIKNFTLKFKTKNNRKFSWKYSNIIYGSYLKTGSERVRSIQFDFNAGVELEGNENLVWELILFIKALREEKIWRGIGYTLTSIDD